MYRIELTPGEVTVFRTIEELATGVRNGLISPKARIFHNASAKWLPIEFHPHYKAALALLAGRPSDTTVSAPKPAEPPSFENLSFLKPQSEKLSGDKSSGDKPLGDKPAIEQVPSVTPPGDNQPAGSPRGEKAVKLPAREVQEPVKSARQTDDVQAGLSRNAARVLARDPGTQIGAPEVPGAPRSGRSPASRSPFGLPLRVELEGEPEHRPAPPRAPPRLRDPFFDTDASDEQSMDGDARLTSVAPPPIVPRSLPSVTASPVLELPKISYPEFRPAEPPVTESSSAGRPRRRLVYVAGVLVVLAAGGYGASLVLSPAWHDPARTERPAATMPSPAMAPDVHPAVSGAEGARRSPPSPTHAAASPRNAPAVSNQAATPTAPLPPASSGFAPALEPRAIVSTPLKTSSPAPSDSVPHTGPSIEMDLVMPALQAPDSLTGAQPRQGDSAMKKILRALNGGKDAPTQP
ncbi:MAG: hypothetical protein ACTHM9_14950 [Gemmatimonadales bacterium]